MPREKWKSHILPRNTYKWEKTMAVSVSFWYPRQYITHWIFPSASQRINYISKCSDKCQENLYINLYRENCLAKSCMSVAEEGKVFWAKKILRPLLDNHEGTQIIWTSFLLTSPTLTVYSNVHSRTPKTCLHRVWSAFLISTAIRTALKVFSWLFFFRTLPFSIAYPCW